VIHDLLMGAAWGRAMTVALLVLVVMVAEPARLAARMRASRRVSNAARRARD